MPPSAVTPDAPNSGSITWGESPRDEQGRKYIDWPDGSRFYLKPDAGSPLYFQGSTGGLIHNPDSWNPKTGQWEPGGVNWGALVPWLGLAGIGGATAAAALSATVPGAVASQAGATVGTSGAAATGAGVGIGETGAVSGLAGSGLAGELGGIGATTVTAGGVGMPAVAGANGGILDSIGGIAGAAKKVAPILGQMNQNRAANQQATDQTRILQKNYELGAPAKRLDTSRKASLLANFQPVKAQWGGPGSGLRGEHVNFTGGFSNPDLYSPDTKALAQDVMHKQLLASLNGEDKLPDAGKSSIWDKILGGVGTGASILGAFA